MPRSALAILTTSVDIHRVDRNRPVLNFPMLNFSETFLLANI